MLHVGNIANNAYLVAKFLRRAGVDADVLCYDYYHIMGTPEWEELDIQHDWGDDFRPRFAPEDIGDYRRPDWFVQGPLRVVLLISWLGIGAIEKKPLVYGAIWKV